MNEQPEMPEAVARFLQELERLIGKFGEIEQYFLRTRGGHYQRSERVESGMRHRYELASESAFELLSGLTDRAEIFESRPAGYGFDPPPLHEKAGNAVSCLGAIRLEAMENPKRWLRKLEENGRVATAATRHDEAEAPRRIFLGHGRNLLWREVEAHLKECDLEVAHYGSESRTGHHVVATLQEFLDECGFAVMVATAEDATDSGSTRARQNVVHEIGLFQGRRGFDRVAILVQDGVESFSNIAGLEHIPFAGEVIEAAFPKLDRMLEREGLLPRRGRAGAGA